MTITEPNDKGILRQYFDHNNSNVNLFKINVVHYYI